MNCFKFKIKVVLGHHLSWVLFEFELTISLS